jgi:formate-dependent phosphoribosylglycinamide formyltransferase (GAR transformylase)
MPTILVLETNTAGTGTKALGLAKDLGLRTHFLCRSREEYERHALSPLDVADEVDVVDTFDMAKVLRVVDGRTDYIAVLAYDELRVVQAALVGQYLRVPHNPRPAAMVRSRFKDRLRRALSTTRWAVRHQLVPLTATTSPIGYPCVVKPVDEAGSVGVTLCHDDADFAHALGLLRAVTGRPTVRGHRLSPIGLVEEMLPGEEFSAEMVWSAARNEWRIIGFTTKELSEGTAAEVGHIFPHHFEPAVAEQVATELRGCLDHLGLRHTLVHVEFRLSGERFSLIEINPRPAGNRINDLVTHTMGVSLVELHLAAHLGSAEESLGRARPRGYAGVRFLLPERPGTVRSLHVDPAPEDHRDTVELYTVDTPREIGPNLNNDSYLGYALARGESPDEVSRLLDQHIGRVRTVYAPTIGEAA